MSDIVVSEDIIQGKILFIRGKKVLMDRDLAVLYGVETKVLNQAVRRNIKRFPDDFMFQLTREEMKIWSRYLERTEDYKGKPTNLKSQFVTSSLPSDMPTKQRSQIVTLSYGGTRKRPFVFTEQGVAMLSSVLKSDRAIRVNIQIMRTFTKLREMMAGNRDLREKLERMEQKYDNRFKVVFGVIKRLLADEERPKKRIGFDLKNNTNNKSWEKEKA